jgi:hypothetical protein
MIRPLDFAARYLGQRVTSPGGLGGECVDLANLWVAQSWGLPHQFRNAVDWASDPLLAHPWQANTPTNAPMPGSLVVWGKNSQVGTGVNGHIAIALDADANHLVTLDQNWGAQVVTLQMHSYEGVLGWLKP